MTNQDQEPDLEQRLRELAEKARAPKPKKRYWPYLAMGAIGIAAAIAVVYELGNNSHTLPAPDNNQQYQVIPESEILTGNTHSSNSNRQNNVTQQDVKPNEVGSPITAARVGNIADANFSNYNQLVNKLNAGWQVKKGAAVSTFSDFENLMQLSLYSQALLQYGQNHSFAYSDVQRINSEISNKALDNVIGVLTTFQVNQHVQLHSQGNYDSQERYMKQNWVKLLDLYKQLFGICRRYTNSNYAVNGEPINVNNTGFLQSLASRMVWASKNAPVIDDKVGSTSIRLEQDAKSFLDYLQSETTGLSFPGYETTVKPNSSTKSIPYEKPAEKPSVRVSPRKEPYDWGNHSWKSPEDAREWNLQPPNKGDRPAR